MPVHFFAINANRKDMDYGLRNYVNKKLGKLQVMQMEVLHVRDQIWIFVLTASAKRKT